MKRVVTFLLAAGLVLAVAAPASAAPPSSDPITDAKAAAAWLASKVNASGFIPLAVDPTKADFSGSAQAVSALVAAGVGKTKVTALLGYLGNHVDDFVASGGSDNPGSLASLILAAKAGGQDPTSFGSAHSNLVTRLVATQQSDGLFGTASPTFDGVFREGLSLLALHAAGVSNPAGVTWLEGQQCADGLFVAFRDAAQLTVPCPAVDPATFAGSDTNSTALAVLGLVAQGDTAAAGKAVAALEAVRNPAGGWGFLSSSTVSIDPNSTGVVIEALRTAGAAVDAKDVSALLTFQIGCTGAAADRGGIRFDLSHGPDVLATVQATPALTGAALPIGPGTISDDVPAACPTSSTTTTVSASGSTVTTLATTGSTSSSGTVAVAGELPRTGSSSSGPIAIVAASLLGVGALFAGGARRRRG